MRKRLLSLLCAVSLLLTLLPTSAFAVGVGFKDTGVENTPSITIEQKGGATVYDGQQVSVLKDDAEGADTADFTYSFKQSSVEGAAAPTTYDVNWYQKKDYTTGDSNNKPAVENNAATPPTNVGEYVLVVTGKGSDDAVVATGEKEFTITAKTITPEVTVTDANSLTYDGTEKKPTVTVKNGETSLKADTDYTVTYKDNTNASTDTAKVIVSPKEGGNYTWTPNVETPFTIKQAEITVENGAFTEYNGKYDGQEHSITVDLSKIKTVNNQQAAVMYGTTEGTYNASELPKFTDVNTEGYTVYYKITAPNHADKTGSAKVIINKADAPANEVKAAFSVRFNDMTDKTVAIENFDGLPEGILKPVIKQENISQKTDENNVIAEGLTSTKFKLAENLKNENLPKTASWNVIITSDNYADITATVTVTVTSKDVNKNAMTVTQESFEYGLKEVNPQITGVEGTPTFTYAGRDGTTHNDSKTAPTNAGKYTVTATLNTETTVYTATANFEITPKSIAGATITLQKDSTDLTNNELVYTGAEQIVTVGSVSLGAAALEESNYNATEGLNGTNVGTYTVKVEGKGNYKDTAQVTWKITPAPLTIESVTLAPKTYDDTTDAEVSTVTFKSGENTVTLDKNTDYIATGKFEDANAGKDKKVTVTVTLKGDAANNYMPPNTFDKTGVEIKKAAAPAAPTGLYGIKGQKLITVNLPAGWSWVDRDTEMSEAGENKTFKANYTDAQGNYEAASNVDVTVAVKDKTDVSNKISFTDGTLTYNGKGQKYEEATIEIPSPAADKWTYTYTAGTGKMNDDNLPSTAGTYTVTAKYEDDSCIGTKTVTLTIIKAKPTGEPKYDLIKEDGKTLANANLSANGITPTGQIVWMENDATLNGDTKVVANKEYKWVFTPNDTNNYETLSGTVVLYTKSAPVTPSQPGSGTISGSGTVKTDTVTNPDGSVTKTETKRDGTVIETTTGKDGSVSKTTTNPNGSSVTETKAADGSTGTVKTDERGQTTAQTTLSSKAIETAKRNGEPVKAPVEVNATRDSSTAPTVKIELPRNSGDTNVEIPVTNVKPGTVAVLVHPDGTEEIVKNSRPTEDGIQLTVNGGATVKIMDNSKDFIDTRAHWAKDAIDFVSARGLVDGMNAVSYAPDASTTRAQLWTILARQNNADLTGGTNWYEKAQLWAKDKGVSDGANPNDTINRAQMVTMLWRTMGQPVAASGASFADVPADSYYAQAVAWAVENGITTGVGDGRFDPNGACTRGQIATFLYRYMK